jgi:hypothetical protein
MKDDGISAETLDGINWRWTWTSPWASETVGAEDHPTRKQALAAGRAWLKKQQR